VHVITGLSRGGAEAMLCKLLSRADRRRYEPQVISLTEIGPVGREIEELGVPVRALGMKPGLPSPLLLLRLAGWLRSASPDIVQTWMYHADLIGGLAAKLAGGIPVIWGLRQSQLDPARSKKTTIWTARACAALSASVPERIICCSHVAAHVHRQLGYAADKLQVIPNGFDLVRFSPARGMRASVRQELGIALDAHVVGMVARFDPQKDFPTLIEAARHLNSREPWAQFVLCGKEVTPENAELTALIEASGQSGCFHLLGERRDVERLLPAFDVCCLSSAFGEGFPNVLGEAMACQVPCVATDVGDSANIIGDTGVTVPPSDPAALAGALGRLLRLSQAERTRLGEAARARIAATFELDVVTRQFEALYRDVLKSRTD
jgi:glycosyltransferase involved in cell wall biosynthesis